MSEFWLWFQRVGAFAVWLVILWLSKAVRDLFHFVRDYQRAEAERAKKWKPYTKAEARECPNQEMIVVDLYRGDEKVTDVGVWLPKWLHRDRVPVEAE